KAFFYSCQDEPFPDDRTVSIENQNIFLLDVTALITTARNSYLPPRRWPPLSSFRPAWSRKASGSAISSQLSKTFRRQLSNGNRFTNPNKFKRLYRIGSFRLICESAVILFPKTFV